VTDCGGFSTFLASLLQSIGIPSRLVVGFLIIESVLKRISSMFHVPRFTFHDLSMHAWLEVLLPNNSWFPLDPSIEWRRANSLTKREGGFGFIPADRLVVSFGQDFTLNIQGETYRVDLLQNPVSL
ncbi:transglutaminase domain-containing protein, partial [Candidatus Roizmanbacteria bacterium]|nr:transglutaminase domain-containing protein [Candidatus Roizmanbacteria bacterium]